MKNVWRLFVAIALLIGCAGAIQADEPSLAVVDAPGLAPLQADHSPMTRAKEIPAPLDPHTTAICQPGTFQYNCKEIWGVAQGRCGANTWRYTFCKQYKNSAGQWYYQNCGTVQEVCSPPGGAECIPCL